MASQPFNAAMLRVMRVTLLPAGPVSFALILTLLVPPAAAAPARPGAASDATRYRACLNMSGLNPSAALGDAEAWIKSGGGVPAEHCAALSLVGLKRYGEAGARLGRLAAAKDVPGTAFRVELFSQAGNAWLLAGDGGRAAQNFTSAVALSPGDADLFADLARAHAMRRNWTETVTSLNAALNLQPRRADLLVLRASARRALRRYADAHADLAAALKLKPGDGGALLERGLLRKQLGDLNGARRDFQAAMKAAPGSDVAATAQDNLESLD